MDTMRAKQPAPSSLSRRNSIASSVIPTKLSLPRKSQSSIFPQANGEKSSPALPTVGFELVSLKSSLSYTSLKELIQTNGVQSPTTSGAHSDYELPIRNRLVKQAAWAYLQPMSTSPASSGRHILRRIWMRFSDEYLRNPVSACVGFINRHVIPTITRAFDRFVRAVWVRRDRDWYDNRYK